jgi:hypothetical protein
MIANCVCSTRTAPLLTAFCKVVSTVRQQHFNLVRGANEQIDSLARGCRILRIAARDEKTWKTRREIALPTGPRRRVSSVAAGRNISAASAVRFAHSALKTRVNALIVVIAITPATLARTASRPCNTGPIDVWRLTRRVVYCVRLGLGSVALRRLQRPACPNWSRLSFRRCVDRRCTASSRRHRAWSRRHRVR